MKLAQAIKAAKEEAWKTPKQVVNIFVTDGFAVAVRNRNDITDENGYMFQVRTVTNEHGVFDQSVLFLGRLDEVSDEQLAEVA